MNQKGEHAPATGSSLASAFLGGSEPHVSEIQGPGQGAQDTGASLAAWPSPADSGHALPPWLPSDTPPWLWEPGQPAASIPQHSLSLQGRRQLQACLPGAATPSAPPCRQRWSRAGGQEWDREGCGPGPGCLSLPPGQPDPARGL